MFRAPSRLIDERPLTLSGGVFTTIANRMKQEVGYNYWARNIVIDRSRTTVAGLTHHVTGETEFGHPYRGFISVSGCADIVLRDCFVSGHKTYRTIGAAGHARHGGNAGDGASAAVVAAGLQARGRPR